MINSTLRRSITAMKGEYYCPHCAKRLHEEIGHSEPETWLNVWCKDGAGRIKCRICNNVVA